MTNRTLLPRRRWVKSIDATQCFLVICLFIFCNAAASSIITTNTNTNSAVKSSHYSSRHTPPISTKPFTTPLLHHPRGGSSPSSSSSSSSAIIEGLKNSLASGVAAAFSKTCLAPFDTIKTIQQQQRGAGNSALTLWQAAQLVMGRGKGVFELYAGLGVAVLGSMPSVGLYFGCYSYSKRVIGPFLDSRFGAKEGSSAGVNRDKLLKTLTIATSAAIGNSIASVSRVPYEVLKQNLQTGHYKSFSHAIRASLSSPASLFPPSSISTQMLRDIPYAIFTLLSYEYLRDHWVQRGGRPRESWRDAVAGGLAGGVGSYLTNPLDVLKTRLQTLSGAGGGGVWKCAVMTWTEEGASGFLKGSVPRLIHKVPANALFFLAYEFMRAVLGVHVSESDTNTDNLKESGKVNTQPQRKNLNRC